MYTLKKKGQAALEFVVILHLFLLLLHIVVFFSTYMFDRLIVLYAANTAINEGMAMIPNLNSSSVRDGDIKGYMEGRARDVLNYRFSRGQTSVSADIKDYISGNPSYATLEIQVISEYQESFFVSQFLAGLFTIEQKMEVDYVW